MKKEKPKEKQKEFAASPFKALKGVAVGRTEPAPPPPPKKPVKPREEVDDQALFFEAMAEVQRIHPLPAAKDKGKEQPAQAGQAAQRARRDEEDQKAFMEAVGALKIDVRFSDDLPEEEGKPHRPPPVNRLRQVRRGTIRVDLELDLHGLTRDEAIENLERFVRGAHNRGQKGVLVITGKGNNSPGEPILKAAVIKWLREEGKEMVAEFAAAPREMGGSGALVVFLKDKKAQEQPETTV
jgi:DNA-nicking Smr family endonuclease